MSYPEVIYKDNQIIIAVKPFNMPSQEDMSGDPDMLSVLKKYIKEEYGKPGNVFLGLLHRLDRPAGGLMVFARNSKSASRLSELIRKKEMTKEYLAVVNGKLEGRGRYKDIITKDSKKRLASSSEEEVGKNAELSWKTLGRAAGTTLVRIMLITGRSHQIRFQFASRGHYIIGDHKYGPDKEKMTTELALWSYRIGLVHPVSKIAMEFKAVPPPSREPWNEFGTILSKLRNG